MKVSVIVPVYNEEKYLEACLKSILNQTLLPDEVIIVDNNSTDKSTAIAKKYNVRIVREKKQGMIYARNKGFSSARYSILARTDADTIVPVDWIKNITKHFTADASLVALAGPAAFNNLPNAFEVSRWPTKLFFKSFKKICGHECLYGPNMAIRASAWKKVKNEVCVSDHDVHEDMDMALHIAYYGKILFDPHLVVHSSPRRWKKITPYFEYPLRYLKTIQQHYHSIAAIKRSKNFIYHFIPGSQRIIRSIVHAKFT